MTALLAGIVVGSVSAQDPFAQPWDVSFAHIQDSMKFGTYYIEQARRQRQEHAGDRGFPGVLSRARPGLGRGGAGA